MDFNGGVIIIGSLLWDNDEIRRNWRSACLKSIECKQPVELRIRYDRESISRKSTYTMIFSNSESTQLGKGFVIEFKNKIKNFEGLKEQAIEIAKAEKIWKTDFPYIVNDWGAVGLLINPEKLSKNSNLVSIKDSWTQYFNDNKRGLKDCKNKDFKHCDYRIEENETPVIDKNGFLEIPWPVEVNDFDFLIATPTSPKPKKFLLSDEIARRMHENKYREYFDSNRNNNIQTFQDEEILKLIQ